MKIIGGEIGQLGIRNHERTSLGDLVIIRVGRRVHGRDDRCPKGQVVAVEVYVARIPHPTRIGRST